MRLVTRTLDDLEATLHRIDGRGYRAYKDIQGQYACNDFVLHIDHVQGDPFAAPSRLRAVIPHPVAAIPKTWRSSAIRRVALADFLARAFARCCMDIERRRGSGKSGLIDIDTPRQEVLERTACLIDDGGVELRFSVGLPASGRRVLGRQAAALLLDDVPDALLDAVCYDEHDPAVLARHIETVEDTAALRRQLEERELVAFIANGALLPRRSGIDPRPMALEEVVLFQSPPELEVALALPRGGEVRGQGGEVRTVRRNRGRGRRSPRLASG